MLSITKVNKSLKVDGLDNRLFPDNGTLSIPLNSLILSMDASDIVTFRSSANDNVYFSAKINDIRIAGQSVTKQTIISAFDAVANAASGEGGIEAIEMNGSEVPVTQGTADLGDIVKTISLNGSEVPVTQGTADLGDVVKSIFLNGTDYYPYNGELPLDSLVNYITFNGETYNVDGTGQIDLGEQKVLYYKGITDDMYPSDSIRYPQPGDLRSLNINIKCAVRVQIDSFSMDEDSAMFTLSAFPNGDIFYFEIPPISPGEDRVLSVSGHSSGFYTFNENGYVDVPLYLLDEGSQEIREFEFDENSSQGLLQSIEFYTNSAVYFEQPLFDWAEDVQEYIDNGGGGGGGSKDITIYTMKSLDVLTPTHSVLNPSGQSTAVQLPKLSALRIAFNGNPMARTYTFEALLGDTAAYHIRLTASALAGNSRIVTLEMRNGNTVIKTYTYAANIGYGYNTYYLDIDLHEVIPSDVTLSNALNVVENSSSSHLVVTELDYFVDNNGSVFNTQTQTIQDFADETKADISNKQNTLVSQTNIKSVNNYSLLGSGNLSVGTITGITMNGASKGTSGVVNLGTVITDISGKQDVIDSSHKLDADLVDDTTSTNKFVTASDKTTWNGKQDTLVSGTNIKTINNESILGSGNITIQGGGTQVQADWNQSDTTAVDYIKNKPTIPTVPTNVSSFTNDAGYITSAALSSYYTKTEIDAMIGTINTQLSQI